MINLLEEIQKVKGEGYSEANARQEFIRTLYCME